MTVFAIIRPDEWNFPLFVHVLGAMVLVGGLALAASALILAWRATPGDATAALVRLGYRSLLLGAVPAWIVMRGGAQWIADKENLTDSTATWIEIGFQVADPGVLFLFIATVLCGVADRRLVQNPGPSLAVRISAGLVSVLIAAYVLAIWAMTTKPA